MALLQIAILDIISDNMEYDLQQANFAIYMEKGYIVKIGDTMIKPSQCRAARALLGWSQQQLADVARIGNATLRNFESGAGIQPRRATLEMLRQALEAAGVQFIPENGGGAGVRMRERSDSGEA